MWCWINGDSHARVKEEELLSVASRSASPKQGLSMIVNNSWLHLSLRSRSFSNLHDQSIFAPELLRYIIL